MVKARMEGVDSINSEHGKGLVRRMQEMDFDPATCEVYAGLFRLACTVSEQLQSVELQPEDDAHEQLRRLGVTWCGPEGASAAARALVAMQRARVEVDGASTGECLAFAADCVEDQRASALSLESILIFSSMPLFNALALATCTLSRVQMSERRAARLAGCRLPAGAALLPYEAAIRAAMQKQAAFIRWMEGNHVRAMDIVRALADASPSGRSPLGIYGVMHVQRGRTVSGPAIHMLYALSQSAAGEKLARIAAGKYVDDTDARWARERLIELMPTIERKRLAELVVRHYPGDSDKATYQSQVLKAMNKLAASYNPDIKGAGALLRVIVDFMLRTQPGHPHAIPADDLRPWFSSERAWRTGMSRHGLHNDHAQQRLAKVYLVRMEQLFTQKHVAGHLRRGATFKTQWITKDKGNLDNSKYAYHDMARLVHSDAYWAAFAQASKVRRSIPRLHVPGELRKLRDTGKQWFPLAQDLPAVFFSDPFKHKEGLQPHDGAGEGAGAATGGAARGAGQ